MYFGKLILLSINGNKKVAHFSDISIWCRFYIDDFHMALTIYRQTIIFKTWHATQCKQRIGAAAAASGSTRFRFTDLIRWWRQEPETTVMISRPMVRDHERISNRPISKKEKNNNNNTFIFRDKWWWSDFCLAASSSLY